jgi:hypothetical protein
LFGLAWLGFWCWVGAELDRGAALAMTWVGDGLGRKVLWFFLSRKNGLLPLLCPALPWPCRGAGGLWRAGAMVWLGARPMRPGLVAADGPMMIEEG